MHWFLLGTALAMTLGCSAKRSDDASRPDTAAAPTGERDTDAPASEDSPCQQQPFKHRLPLAEASGAVWFLLDQEPTLAVIGDSGTSGAYVLISPETGAVRESGRLPLGIGASDDLEGLSARQGELYAITSSGWIRQWRRRRDEFVLVATPYPIAEVDRSLEPVPGTGSAPIAGSGLACVGEGINCGKNYEGLCLRAGPVGHGECAGFAASKGEGRLYCLTLTQGRLHGDPGRSIAVVDPGHLTSCDFSTDDEILWVGTNAFGGSRMYRVDDWRKPAESKVVFVATLGPGFPEASAVGPEGEVYRFSDTGSSPSFQRKFRCVDDRR
jgi:hypothetical protein